ncbi:MAG TPA: 16S rRNA (guanine(527)-N(7))-methyltransferase RsmG [Anaerolineales bacterium]
MPSESQDLARAAQSLFGLRLSSGQLHAFSLYARELQVWNRRVNLTAITEPREIEVKHFLDSLSCLLVLKPRAGDKLVDVGSGAGFPGIPLKIACPQIKLILVESIGKKADFCRHIVRLLGLEGIEVMQARAEQLGRDPNYRGQHDWAVARAVARLPVLLEYLLPLLRVDGVAIAHKGESGPAETITALPALQRLGGVLQQVVPVELPGVSETHFLIVVKKINETPAKYPRRPGIVAKRPITG